MRSACLIIILILLVRIPAFSLTGHSRVSILTAEPGNELYTIFGHTAIRITDESLNMDRIYNFGTFDFSSPFFYLKFLKGNLDYFLSVADYTSFMHHSTLENRKIHEQVLDLNYNERINIFNKLEQCYHSKDRYYQYDFFFDNCATRVRDVIFDKPQGHISYDTAVYCCKTFRQLLKPYITTNYWIELGVNLALGNEADRLARSYDFMFLPDYIEHILQTSGSVSETGILLDSVQIKSYSRRNALIVLWLIIFLLTWFSMIKKTRRITFYIFNATVGIIGLILLLNSIISDNSAFTHNMNIIWTFPALILILIPRGQLRKKLEVLFILLLLTLLLFRGMVYPGFSTSFLPWMLLLMVIYILDLQWIAIPRIIKRDATN